MCVEGVWDLLTEKSEDEYKYDKHVQLQTQLNDGSFVCNARR